jgi:hypothetical protein
MAGPRRHRAARQEFVPRSAWTPGALLRTTLSGSYHDLPGEPAIIRLEFEGGVKIRSSGQRDLVGALSLGGA